MEEDSEEVVDGEVSEEGGFGGVQEINGEEDEEKSHHEDRKRVQRAFDCHFSQILLKSRSYLYQHFTAYSHFWKDLEKLLGDDPLQCPDCEFRGIKRSWTVKHLASVHDKVETFLGESTVFLGSGGAAANSDQSLLYHFSKCT